MDTALANGLRTASKLFPSHFQWISLHTRRSILLLQNAATRKFLEQNSKDHYCCLMFAGIISGVLLLCFYLYKVRKHSRSPQFYKYY